MSTKLTPLTSTILLYIYICRSDHTVCIWVKKSSFYSPHVATIEASFHTYLVTTYEERVLEFPKHV